MGDRWGKNKNKTMTKTPRTNSKTMRRAANLRKNTTPAEKKLWAYLERSQLGVPFRRQHAIGNFIVDFCCVKKKLIVELDGSQHLDLQEYDEDRTAYLKSRGYRVIRFWNNDVMNDINGVILAITYALEA
jgi:very-short-patch-repair endonuclease